MASNAEAIQRWFDVRLGLLDNSRKGLIQGSSVVTRTVHNQEAICSYGAHHPLAVMMPDKFDGLPLVLLNGDVPSVSTNRHTAETRSVATSLKNRGLLRYLIIPFSTLDAAGINKMSIDPKEIKEDGTIKIKEFWGTDKESLDELHKKLANMHREILIDGGFYDVYNIVDNSILNATDEIKADSRIHINDGKFLYSYWPRGDNGATRIYEVPVVNGKIELYRSEHQLGNSVFSANYRRERRVVDQTNSIGFRTTYKTEGDSGTAWFLSAFDNQETWRYFLSQLPVACNTYEEAIEAIKPDGVRQAEADGRNVYRQGDVFIIEPFVKFNTRDLKKAGGKFYPIMTNVFGSNHNVSNQMLMPDGTTYGRGFMWHKPPLFREQPHKRIAIGSDWHIIERNMVPALPRGDTRIFASWQSNGRVD